MDNKLLILIAAKACDEKKAKDIKLINIDKVSFISEWILIAEGLSDVQVRSITNSVEVELRQKANIEPLRNCLLYTSPSPRDSLSSRMPSSA